MSQIKKKEVSTPNPMKEGKKSVKDIHKDLGFGDLATEYGARSNVLQLDPALAKELEEKQLVPRWLNNKIYKEKGFHRSDWVPYKRESSPKNSVVTTQNMDGYTIYKDLILGVKPKDWNEHHKQVLMRKANSQNDVQKKLAEDFKDFSSNRGGGASITVGYDEN